MMLDNGGDSVVLVSTIPSPFIVADDLAHKPPSSAAVPASSVPAQPNVVSASVPTDDRPIASPDDCSEITSTVADEPTTVRSPSAASPPPPDYWKESTTAGIRGVLETKLTITSQAPALVSSPSETPIPVVTSTCVTTTTTTTSQQAVRQKKSLEMVVNRLKRPSTSTPAASSTATVFTPAESTALSLPVVTSSGTLSASGHVVLNGGACSVADDDSIRLSLLQRLIGAPSPAYRQPPVPASSHFRFRSVTGNGNGAESGPPIKQLKHMCKNVRSFVPSGPRRPAQWRHPALDLLFGAPPVPVTRHRAAAMHLPPRVASAYRGGAYVRGQDFARPRLPSSAQLTTSGSGAASRDRKQQGDGELSSLMRVLLEASGNSRLTSTSSSSSTSSYPSSTELWKAAIN